MATVKLDKPKLRLLESFQRNKSKKLIKLRQDNRFCDLTLKSDDGFEIKVHRLVVSSASKYFEDLLTTPMREMYQDCISLPDITGVVLEKIISFIYTNEFKEKIEDIKQIIKYAVIFQLEELIEICSSILVENINNNTCVRYWRLARDCLIYSMEEKCLAYIVSKAGVLFKKGLLNDFTIEEMRCLLAENTLHLQFDEQTIFQNVWKWTTGKISDTITFLEVFSQVVDLLRFSGLNRDFLFETIFCNKQLLEDADLLDKIGKLTINEQLLQDDKHETPETSSTVSICKMTSRRLLGFGDNQMLKDIGKGSTLIVKQKLLPEYFGYTTFGNNFFICGGINSKSCKWLEPISEKWQKLPSLKSPKHSHSCSYFDNKIYACGGIDRCGIKSNTVQIFDFGKQKWYRGPDMVSEISNFGLTRVNGSLYAVGNDNIQTLDSRAKHWSVINSDLRRISSFYNCVSIGPKIHCFFSETRNIFDIRVNKFVDEVNIGNLGLYGLRENFCELDGYIYSFELDEDYDSMNLVQYHLDGSRGYTKFLAGFNSGSALVALNY